MAVSQVRSLFYLCILRAHDGRTRGAVLRLFAWHCMVVQTSASIGGLLLTTKNHSICYETEQPSMKACASATTHSTLFSIVRGLRPSSIHSHSNG